MVTPLGCGVTHNWEGLLGGNSGADHIKNFNAEKLKCTIACEVPKENGQPGSFIEEEWIEKKEIKKIDVNAFSILLGGIGREFFKEENKNSITLTPEDSANSITRLILNGIKLKN